MAFVRNSSISLLASSFILSIAMSSCSKNSEPFTMAEKGVTAGAVVGAGLGALVGSTSGDAGAGLVIGTIAGATGGGLVGSAMEDSDVKGSGSSKSARSKGANSRTALNESSADESFLGKNIWGPAPKLVASNDTDSINSRKYVSLSNKPSGSRGVASRFGQVKKPEEFIAPSVESRETSSRARLDSTTNSPGSFSGSPVVQLIKPREDDLPKARVVKLADPELPPASKAVLTSSTKAEFPTLNRKTNTLDSVKTTKKISLVQPEVIVPTIKTNVESVKKIKEGSIARAIETKTDLSEVKVAKSEVITGEVEKVKVVAEKPVEIVEDTKKEIVAAKSISPVISGCENGKDEIKRATNSASDSDKVFYLRRAILACPDNSTLRVDLAKVYGRLGLKDDAKREFTSAIEIDPSNEAAQEELSIIMLESSN